MTVVKEPVPQRLGDRQEYADSRKCLNRACGSNGPRGQAYTV